MVKKLKKVFSLSLDPGYRNYTIRDIIDLKGKKKLTQICVNTAKEAAAAEEAGIDIISDGEIRRESYSAVLSNSLGGIDYINPGEALERSGHKNLVPRVISPIIWSKSIESENIKFLKAVVLS